MKETVQYFKALADPARLQILEFLLQQECCCSGPGQTVCACHIEERVTLAQPTISHHMKVLVDSGLVKSEKRGRWVYYSIDYEAFQHLADFVSRYRGNEAATARQGEQ